MGILVPDCSSIRIIFSCLEVIMCVMLSATILPHLSNNRSNHCSILLPVDCMPIKINTQQQIITNPYNQTYLTKYGIVKCFPKTTTTTLNNKFTREHDNSQNNQYRHLQIEEPPSRLEPSNSLLSYSNSSFLRDARIGHPSELSAFNHTTKLQTPQVIILPSTTSLEAQRTGDSNQDDETEESVQNDEDDDNSTGVLNEEASIEDGDFNYSLQSLHHQQQQQRRRQRRNRHPETTKNRLIQQLRRPLSRFQIRRREYMMSDDDKGLFGDNSTIRSSGRRTRIKSKFEDTQTKRQRLKRQATGDPIDILISSLLGGGGGESGINNDMVVNNDGTTVPGVNTAINSLNRLNNRRNQMRELLLQILTSMVQIAQRFMAGVVRQTAQDLPSRVENFGRLMGNIIRLSTVGNSLVLRAPAISSSSSIRSDRNTTTSTPSSSSSNISLIEAQISRLEKLANLFRELATNSVTNFGLNSVDSNTTNSDTTTTITTSSTTTTISPMTLNMLSKDKTIDDSLEPLAKSMMDDELVGGAEFPEDEANFVNRLNAFTLGIENGRQLKMIQRKRGQNSKKSVRKKRSIGTMLMFGPLSKLYMAMMLHRVVKFQSGIVSQAVMSELIRRYVMPSVGGTFSSILPGAATATATATAAAAAGGGVLGQLKQTLSSALTAGTTPPVLVAGGQEQQLQQISPPPPPSQPVTLTSSLQPAVGLGQPIPTPGGEWPTAYLPLNSECHLVAPATLEGLNQQQQQRQMMMMMQQQQQQTSGSGELDAQQVGALMSPANLIAYFLNNPAMTIDQRGLSLNLPISQKSLTIPSLLTGGLNDNNVSQNSAFQTMLLKILTSQQTQTGNLSSPTDLSSLQDAILRSNSDEIGPINELNFAGRRHQQRSSLRRQQQQLSKLGGTMEGPKFDGDSEVLSATSIEQLSNQTASTDGLQANQILDLYLKQASPADLLKLLGQTSSSLNGRQLATQHTKGDDDDDDRQQQQQQQQLMKNILTNAQKSGQPMSADAIAEQILNKTLELGLNNLVNDSGGEQQNRVNGSNRLVKETSDILLNSFAQLVRGLDFEQQEQQSTTKSSSLQEEEEEEDDKKEVKKSTSTQTTEANNSIGVGEKTTTSPVRIVVNADSAVSLIEKLMKPSQDPTNENISDNNLIGGVEDNKLYTQSSIEFADGGSVESTTLGFDQDTDIPINNDLRNKDQSLRHFKSTTVDTQQAAFPKEGGDDNKTRNFNQFKQGTIYRNGEGTLQAPNKFNSTIEQQQQNHHHYSGYNNSKHDDSHPVKPILINSQLQEPPPQQEKQRNLGNKLFDTLWPSKKNSTNQDIVQSGQQSRKVAPPTFATTTIGQKDANFVENYGQQKLNRVSSFDKIVTRGENIQQNNSSQLLGRMSGQQKLSAPRNKPTNFVPPYTMQRRASRVGNSTAGVMHIDEQAATRSSSLVNSSTASTTSKHRNMSPYRLPDKELVLSTEDREVTSSVEYANGERASKKTPPLSPTIINKTIIQQQQQQQRNRPSEYVMQPVSPALLPNAGAIHLQSQRQNLTGLQVKQSVSGHGREQLAKTITAYNSSKTTTVVPALTSINRQLGATTTTIRKATSINKIQAQKNSSSIALPAKPQASGTTGLNNLAMALNVMNMVLLNQKLATNDASSDSMTKDKQQQQLKQTTQKKKKKRKKKQKQLINGGANFVLPAAAFLNLQPIQMIKGQRDQSISDLHKLRKVNFPYHVYQQHQSPRAEPSPPPSRFNVGDGVIGSTSTTISTTIVSSGYQSDLSSSSSTTTTTTTQAPQLERDEVKLLANHRMSQNKIRQNSTLLVAPATPNKPPTPANYLFQPLAVGAVIDTSLPQSKLSSSSSVVIENSTKSTAPAPAGASEADHAIRWNDVLQHLNL